LGLWKRRSSSLLYLAREVAKRNGRFPKTREEIESLPNVGQYIANAVLLFCHGEPQPLLDSNMARVLERFFGPRKLADIRYDPYLQALAKACVEGEAPVLMNWGILDFAALVCTQRLPRHDVCTLSKYCYFYKTRVDRERNETCLSCKDLTLWPQAARCP
jgi:A/G-specific adenine glycosylase